MSHSRSMSVGELVQLACLLEATARKPGNVHRNADFDDLTYLDFLLSASAIVEPMNRASRLGLGQTVLECIQRTRQVVSTNTNLGIVLLCTPFAVAGLEGDLRSRAEEVLASLSREDAALVYEAIRLAVPGGMGHVPEQDLTSRPTVDLRETMALAAERDMIARQYANGFADIFGFGLPGLEDALSPSRPLEESIIELHLRLMAEFPDSLISRKAGKETAERSAAMAARVLKSGWPEAEEGRRLLQELDAWLRDPHHLRNPGTTADLVALTLFLAAAKDLIGRESIQAFYAG